MIRTQLIGHLGKDAVVNQVNDKKVINFSVAHSEKDKDGNSKTLWVECAYWSDKTAVAEHLKKGTQVYCEGVPAIREWESNGKTGVNFTLRVGQIQLLGGKQDSQPQQPQTQAATPLPLAATSPEPIDDLPF